MDTRIKAEQDIISAADCWARGVMQNNRLLDLTEQNLLDAVMAYDRLVKRIGLDPSHLPPPPHVPHDMDVEDQIPTVRYSEYTTIHSPQRGIRSVIIEETSEPDSDDIF
jgi:hypothetical protein